MKLKDCMYCGSDTVDTEFRDSIGCIAYVQCYSCRENGPESKNHGSDQDAALQEAIVLWNSWQKES